MDFQIRSYNQPPTTITSTATTPEISENEPFNGGERAT